MSAHHDLGPHLAHSDRANHGEQSEWCRSLAGSGAVLYCYLSFMSIVVAFSGVQRPPPHPRDAIPFRTRSSGCSCDWHGRPLHSTLCYTRGFRQTGLRLCGYRWVYSPSPFSHAPYSHGQMVGSGPGGLPVAVRYVTPMCGL
jgi:hypothetical protein